MRAALLLAVLTALAPPCALGRAGGGDSYSSSNSRSSYSGSSSRSSSRSSYSGSSYSGSSYTGSRYRSGGYRRSNAMDAGLPPFIMVVAAFGFLLFLGGRALLGGVDEWIFSARRADIETVSSASLRDRDAAFDRASFLRHAAAVFARVQEAWSAGSMAAVAPFVSDGVVERFETLLAMQRLEGRVNEVSELSVEGADFVSVLATDAADRVTVRFTARCRDVYRSPEGAVLSDRRDAFEEDWTFLRSAGARGRADFGPAEGACPKCGSAVAAGRAALCAHCRTWLNSGEHGWVLCEISQPAVWRLSSRTAGWALDGQEDAHPALLEDQAAVFFWWVLAAMAKGDVSALAGVVSPAMLARLSDDAAGPYWYGECGVGEVTLTGSKREGGSVFAEFEVLWSGTPRARGGGAAGTAQRFATHLALRRPEGTVRPFAAGLRAAHCAGCGAPAVPGRLACPQCARPRGEAAGDWVLVEARTRPWG